MSAAQLRSGRPHDRAVSPASLWFGLFGAPLVWSLQLLTTYALVAHGCYPRADPLRVPVTGGLGTVVLVVGLVAMAVALAAGRTAWRSWQATRRESAGDRAGRTRFMAHAGVLLSGVFLLGILLNVVPLLLVAPCE
jgi:type IV secretory pathway VirB2 component (pilin)